MLDEIKKQLALHIREKIVNEIFEHYAVLKHCYLLQDWEKCLLRSGKFCEAIVKATYFMRTGNQVSNISVDSELKEVAGNTGLPESIRVIIPRAVRLVYDFRNRRGGAHGSFNPNVMDCGLVVSLADWVVAEFVRTYCTKDAELAMKFVGSIEEKSLPFIEVFDDDYLVLRKGLSARKEIGLILYYRYPERTSVGQLRKWIFNHSASNISSSLANMRNAKIVHVNPEGYILTREGVKLLEKELGERG